MRSKPQLLSPLGVPFFGWMQGLLRRDPQKGRRQLMKITSTTLAWACVILMVLYPVVAILV